MILWTVQSLKDGNTNSICVILNIYATRFSDVVFS